MRIVKMFYFDSGRIAAIFYLEKENIIKIKKFIGGNEWDEHTKDHNWRYERDERGEFLIWTDNKAHLIIRHIIEHDVLYEYKVF